MKLQHIERQHMTNLVSDEWRLKIFFSVDLIGSTSYKAKKAENGDDAEWCLFFAVFPLELTTSYQKQAILKHQKDSFEQVKIWKILGDEILFYADLTNYQHIASHICAFKDSIQNYNLLLKGKKAPVPLCKGTVWTAGFPLSNIEIQINNTPDFIGSSIDAGFRLTKYSSSRKLCLSIEALLMFCTTIIDERIEKTEYPIRFEGKKELKGVLNNAPYPIFWLDIKKDDVVDKWLGKGENCEFNDIVKYCEDFINDSEYLIQPFIVGGMDKFNQIPDDIQNRKEKAVEARIDPKQSIFADQENDNENEKLIDSIDIKIPYPKN